MSAPLFRWLALITISGSYDGNLIVGRSVSIGQPVIFVSMNYR